VNGHMVVGVEQSIIDEGGSVLPRRRAGLKVDVDDLAQGVAHAKDEVGRRRHRGQIGVQQRDDAGRWTVEGDQEGGRIVTAEILQRGIEA
jgi:hypothetical protein